LHVFVRAKPYAYAMLRPVVPGYHSQCRTIRLKLEHGARVDIQRLGSEPRRALENLRRVRSAQRVEAETGERRLPPQRRIELRLGMPLVRDVASDDDHADDTAAVCADNATLGLDHARGAVARDQPV